MNSAHLNASNVENLEPRAEANYLIKVKFCDFSNIEIQPTEKILKCVQCSKEFTDIAKVKSHLLTHTPDEFVTCSYCNDKFISQIKLNEHLKSHEANVAKSKNCFECVHCKRQFGFIDHLLNHFKVHFQNLRFSENELEEEDSLSNAEVDAIDDNDFGSGYKSCSFIKKEKEKEHLVKEVTKKIMGRKRGRKKCVKPKDGIKDDENQKTRKQDRHKGILYKCKYCGMSFDNAPQYITHLHSHRKLSSKLIRHGPKGNVRGRYTSVKLVSDHKECTLCGTEFSSVENSLFDHLTNAHPEINISKLCLFCGKLFPSPNDLRRHIRYHTGEKPFMCPECPFSCSRHDNLRKHLIVHKKSV